MVYGVRFSGLNMLMVGRAPILVVIVCGMLFWAAASAGRIKVVIFDMGDVLVRQDTFKIASSVGLWKFIQGRLFHGLDKVHLRTRMFEVLAQLESPEVLVDAYHKGAPLPRCMTNWLLGVEDGASIVRRAYKKIEELGFAGYFISAFEQDLVGSIIEAAFNPELLAQCTKPVPVMMKIFTLCLGALGADGQPLYRVALLSNWDAQSYKAFCAQPHMRAIFDRIPETHRFISSQMGCVKPDPLAYERVYTALGVLPEECLFFDDESVNVSAAQAAGMQAVLVPDFDYRAMRTVLRQDVLCQQGYNESLGGYAGLAAVSVLAGCALLAGVAFGVGMK